MNKENIKNKGEIIIYQTSGKEVDLKVRLEDENIWLSQKQMSALFDKNVRTINEHIGNIFKEKELNKNSVIRNFRITADDGKKYETNFYSLDVIISVGYRVKSKQGTNFRIWATSVLKNYLIKGYAINKKRLEESEKRFRELQETINFLEKKSKREGLRGQENEILSILADYSKTLTILEEYDKSKLKTKKGQKGIFKLDFEKTLDIISQLKKELIKKKEASTIFGNLKDSSFESIVRNIYQTYGGRSCMGT